MWFSEGLQCTTLPVHNIRKIKTFGGLLTDLLKAFDYLSHELFIAKLNPKGLV